MVEAKAEGAVAAEGEADGKVFFFCYHAHHPSLRRLSVALGAHRPPSQDELALSHVLGILGR